MRIDDPRLISWHTKVEVQELLEITEKTVERMVKRGDLRMHPRRRPNNRPEPVYHPEDVAKIRAAKDARLQEAEAVLELTGPDRGVKNREAAVAPVAQAIQSIVAMGENTAVVAEAVGTAAEQMVEAIRQLNESVRTLTLIQTAARENGVKLLPAAPENASQPVAEPKMILTIRECVELGFVARELRAMVRSGELRNFGTTHRPRVARRQLESLCSGETIDAYSEGTEEALRA